MVLFLLYLAVCSPRRRPGRQARLRPAGLCDRRCGLARDRLRRRPSSSRSSTTRRSGCSARSPRPSGRGRGAARRARREGRLRLHRAAAGPLSHLRDLAPAVAAAGVDVRVLCATEAVAARFRERRRRRRRPLPVGHKLDARGAARVWPALAAPTSCTPTIAARGCSRGPQARLRGARVVHTLHGMPDEIVDPRRPRRARPVPPGVSPRRLAWLRARDPAARGAAQRASARRRPLARARRVPASSTASRARRLHVIPNGIEPRPASRRPRARPARRSAPRRTSSTARASTSCSTAAARAGVPVRARDLRRRLDSRRSSRRRRRGSASTRRFHGFVPTCARPLAERSTSSSCRRAARICPCRSSRRWRPGCRSSRRGSAASRSWSRTATTGLLVEPDDVDALAEAIGKLAADPARRERSARAGAEKRSGSSLGERRRPDGRALRARGAGPLSDAGPARDPGAPDRRRRACRRLARARATRARHEVAVAAAPGALGDELEAAPVPAAAGRAAAVARAGRRWRVRRAMRAFRPDVVHVQNPGMAAARRARDAARPPAARARHRPRRAGDGLRADRAPAARWPACPSSPAGRASRPRSPTHGCRCAGDGRERACPRRRHRATERASSRARDPGGRRLVVAVGRLVRQKNHALATGALADVPGAALAILGEGPLHAELGAQAAARARRASRAPGVRATPARSWARPTRSSCRRWGRAAARGARGARCRTPVVATAVRGLRELLDDDARQLLVPADDPDALAAALRRVLDDHALAQRA